MRYVRPFDIVCTSRKRCDETNQTKQLETVRQVMTMKVKPLGPNQTEVRLGANVIFFSYQEPVAAFIEDRYYRTKKKWSTTTSKHINGWLDGAVADVKPQEWFDNLGAVAHLDGGAS